jgi:hypothetical protein
VAKVASKSLNLAVSAVALEDDITSASLNITQETPEVTALSDTGPRRVAGNYDFNLEMEGAADFAAGQSDATIFALVGAAAAVVGYDPTGAAAAGASDPHYDSSMFLSSYSIRAQSGQGVTFSANLVGATALTRAVA